MVYDTTIQANRADTPIKGRKKIFVDQDILEDTHTPVKGFDKLSTYRGLKNNKSNMLQLNTKTVTVGDLDTIRKSCQKYLGNIQGESCQINTDDFTDKY